MNLSTRAILILLLGLLLLSIVGDDKEGFKEVVFVGNGIQRD